MPFIFVNDGAPEAEEYEFNYIWYDATSEASLERALDLADQRADGPEIQPRQPDQTPAIPEATTAARALSRPSVS